jgi:hypothetical protein
MATEAVAFLMAYKKNVNSSEEEDLDDLIFSSSHLLAISSSGHREIGILAGCSATLRVFTEFFLPASS